MWGVQNEVTIQARVLGFVGEMACIGRICLLVNACRMWPPPPPEIAEGDSAPTFEATGIDGRKINFPASAAGNPSVVLMSATWCPYCTVLMPRLSDIRADYADRGVEVIAINAKERGRGDPIAYMRDAGWDFVTIVDDGNQIAEFYDVK